MNMDFESCETIGDIDAKLLDMNFEDLTELLAVYECKVGELAAAIGKAKGWKDARLDASEKKGIMNFQNIAICKLVYLQGQRLEETIRSNKLIEGVLKDICNAVDRLSDKDV